MQGVQRKRHWAEWIRRGQIGDMHRNGVLIKSGWLRVSNSLCEKDPTLLLALHRNQAVLWSMECREYSLDSWTWYDLMHVEELARVKLGLWGCSFGLFRIVSDACRFCRPASWAPAGYSQISQIQTKISFWRWFGNAPSWLVDDSYPSPSVEVVFGVVKLCEVHVFFTLPLWILLVF